VLLPFHLAPIALIKCCSFLPGRIAACLHSFLPAPRTAGQHARFPDRAFPSFFSSLLLVTLVSSPATSQSYPAQSKISSLPRYPDPACPCQSTRPYRYFTYPQPRKDYPRRSSKSSSLSPAASANLPARPPNVASAANRGFADGCVKGDDTVERGERGFLPAQS